MCISIPIFSFLYRRGRKYPQEVEGERKEREKGTGSDTEEDGGDIQKVRNLKVGV